MKTLEAMLAAKRTQNPALHLQGLRYMEPQRHVDVPLVAARIRVRMGYVIAFLFTAVSLGGLTLSSAYVRETANWHGQALAQDWFDLVVASPAIMVAAWFASRNSRRARTVLAGLELYAVYTLAIYCFAIHLNALFLVYCAAFGVSIYAVISAAASLLREDATTWFQSNLRRRTIGGVLIAIGVAFGALWLAQLVPAVLMNTTPRELVETGLLTNPIHVLDLSFILPLHLIAGVTLLRRRSIGFVLGCALLAFDALMAGSIAFLQVFLEVRRITTGGLPVAIAMAMVAALAVILLVHMLSKMPPPRHRAMAKTSTLLSAS